MCINERPDSCVSAGIRDRVLGLQIGQKIACSLQNVGRSVGARNRSRASISRLCMRLEPLSQRRPAGRFAPRKLLIEAIGQPQRVQHEFEQQVARQPSFCAAASPPCSMCSMYCSGFAGFA